MMSLTDSSITDFFNSVLQNTSGMLPKVLSKVQDKDDAAEPSYSLLTPRRVKILGRTSRENSLCCVNKHVVS